MYNEQFQPTKKSINFIHIIEVVVVILLIIGLTKYISSRKQAVYVASEENSATTSNLANVEQNTENLADKGVWEINNNSNQNINKNTNVSSGNQNNQTNQNIQSNTTSQQQPIQTKKKSEKGVIYLTFDDGPSSNITPKILDILKKENIKATFFVINYSKNNEHLLKREVAEGHTIGIHGYSHEYSKIYKSKDVFLNNVYSLQKKIMTSTGVVSKYVRFPGGSSNTISRRYCKGIMTDLSKELLKRGFKYYDWNISAEDAGSAKNAKDVYNNVTKYLSKKRGNMVLCHDFGGSKKTVEALPKIIKYAKKKGFTFAPIDDNTGMYAQHINN